MTTPGTQNNDGRLMDAALVDRMVEDVRTLAKVNSLVDSTAVDTPGGRPRTVIPYLAVCPAERGTLAQLAVQVFDGRHRNQRGINRRLRSAELRILGRALGGGGPRRGDLFSYLYFDSEFIEASIELGRQDAMTLFEGVPPDEMPWRIGPQQPAAVG